MNTEFGTITDIDDPSASLVCVCKEGKLPGHADGFFPATEDGLIISSLDEVPEHLVPWPDTRYVHALCPDCGRLYSDEEIDATKKARVLKIVDFSEPERKANLEAYIGK